MDYDLADSFTATFYKHKPLTFLKKVGGLWFLASEKWPDGAGRGSCVGLTRGGL